jgi:DNA-binding LytR/AlgR family response regulator
VALIAATVVAITTVNIFSELHEEPGLRRWEPVVWEYSSALAILPALLVPWLALRLAPPGPPWLRFAVVHAAASLVFSAAHVALFVMLRHAAYALAGGDYDFGAGGQFFYEYRKDLLGYVASVLAFWLTPQLLQWRRAAAEPDRASKPSEALFDIRDGARLLRVPPGEIVAVTSAGNYVEVLLADGRRPLTRMTLAQAEAALGPVGFLRVHRSWLVNAGRVRALIPRAPATTRSKPTPADRAALPALSRGAGAPARAIVKFRPAGRGRSRRAGRGCGSARPARSGSR